MVYRTNHSETALTLNTKHQYLKHFESESQFNHIAAFAPTQNWEKLSGYDVHVPLLKTSVYQYKRPKVLESEPLTTGDRQFKLDREQWLTLLLLFEPGEAFFALPVVWANDELPEAVERTLFVDVYGILPDTTRVYIPADSVSDGTVGKFLKARTSSGNEYLLHPRYLYGWDRHRRRIADCTLGLLIRDEEELWPTEYGQEENEPPGYPTTAAFDEFQNRIDKIAGHNTPDGERREWAFERLWRILFRQKSIYRELYTFLTIAENARKNVFHPSDAWAIAVFGSQSDWILSEFTDFTIPEETVAKNPRNLSDNIEHLSETFDIRSAYNNLDSILEKFEQEDVDPTRFRIRSARNAIFGK